MLKVSLPRKKAVCNLDLKITGIKKGSLGEPLIMEIEQAVL